MDFNSLSEMSIHRYDSATTQPIDSVTLPDIDVVAMLQSAAEGLVKILTGSKSTQPESAQSASLAASRSQSPFILKYWGK
ncbi:MAG: hypothetical protein ACD_62C00632G0003 [uncultured bacterium]|nr:MAG: hypothetical protein ACD_62C00632G0003 [uncultured bacterium]